MKVSTRRDTYITRIILNMLHRIKKLLMSIQLSYRLSPKFTIFLLSLLFSSLGLFAQKDKVQVLPTQTIRGEIQDLGSHQLLVGATVELWKDSVFIGTTTDEKGQYRFDKLPLGRYWMEVRFLGYETIVINEILLESGKEFIQDIWLRENPELLNPIIITAAGREVEALQKLSAHTITVEETFRFPATFNDPVRLAMSYPGVVSLNDQANGISIRGNSPNAMQWRLEGAEIVNPNHLSNAGASSDRATLNGGGVNILSAQMLGTSTLWTGAFPVEYGNALGGVMDMRLRKGNDEEHEFTAKIGLIGLTLAAEGPFSDSTDASFLINYRYSFVGLLTSMGVDFGDEEINFQDLSFNVNIPTKKAGEFSLFGMGGKSKNIFERKDSADVEYEKDLLNIRFDSKMGAIGLSHKLGIGSSFWTSSLVFSASQNEWLSDFPAAPDQIFVDGESDNFERKKLSFLTNMDRKLKGSHLKYGLGITYERTDFSSFEARFISGITLFDEHFGNLSSWIIRPYVNWRKELTSKLELQTGAGLSYYTFPKFSYFEPSFQLTYKFNEKESLSFRSSVHSQYFMPEVFAVDWEKFIKRNPGLEPIRTAHTVLSYQNYLNSKTLLTVELYNQNIFQIPLHKKNQSTYSLINFAEGTDWMGLGILGSRLEGESVMINSGIASNVGIDLSLHKFISDEFYYLISGSLYRSTYEDIDNVKHDTRFNGNYVLNLTTGKEFHKTKITKTRIFGMNLRAVLAGGMRYTPFTGLKPDPNDPNPFSRKLNDYFRSDVRFYWKWNKPKSTATLALDIQNVTNRKNEAYYYHDVVKDGIVLKEQLGLIPNLSYKIEF